MWLGSVGCLEGNVGRLKLLQLSDDCNNQQCVRDNGPTDGATLWLGLSLKGQL